MKLNNYVNKLLLLAGIIACLPLYSLGVDETLNDSIPYNTPRTQNSQASEGESIRDLLSPDEGFMPEFILPQTNTLERMLEDNDLGHDKIDKSSYRQNLDKVHKKQTKPEKRDDFPEYMYDDGIDTKTYTYSDEEVADEDNYSQESLYELEREKLAKEQAIIKDIQIEGANNISNELIRSQMQLQSGAHYSRDMLMLDLKNIYDMGYFTENLKAYPSSNPDGTVSIQIVVEENAPITDFTVEGNTVVSTEEILDVLIPIKGKPQNISVLNQAIADVQKLYIDKGFVLSRVDSVTDDPDGTVNIGIVEGKVNKIFITGNKKTKDYIIARNVLTEPGMIYNENMVKEDLIRLYATQAFKDVTREVEPAEDVPDAYDITINVEEQRTATVSVGGGIDTVTGLFGSAGIADNNFRGRNQRLSLNALVGTGLILNDASILRRMNLQAELSFFEPYFLNADTSFLAKAYYRDFGSYQIPLAIERRLGGELTLAHRIKSNKNMTSTFTLGVENIDLKEGGRKDIEKLYAKNNIPISKRAEQLEGGLFLSLSPGLMYDTRDSNTVTRRGTMASIRFDEEFGMTHFSNTHGKLSGMIKHYVPIRKKSSLSFLFRGGGKLHGDMPEVMAYRLGGPYSIRGFKMSGVGTGNAYIMGSVELATPLPFLDRTKINFLQNLRFTMFADAGQMFGKTITDKIYDRPMHAVTVGVGLKLYVPGMGPLSIDYGIPLTNPGHYGNKHGYFTFGVGDLMY